MQMRRQSLHSDSQHFFIILHCVLHCTVRLKCFCSCREFECDYKGARFYKWIGDWAQPGAASQGGGGGWGGQNAAHTQVYMTHTRTPRHWTSIASHIKVTYICMRVLYTTCYCCCAEKAPSLPCFARAPQLRCQMISLLMRVECQNMWNSEITKADTTGCGCCIFIFSLATHTFQLLWTPVC